MDQLGQIVTSIKAVKSQRTGLVVRRRRRKRTTVSLKVATRTTSSVFKSESQSQVSVRKKLQDSRSSSKPDKSRTSTEDESCRAEAAAESEESLQVALSEEVSEEVVEVSKELSSICEVPEDNRSSRDVEACSSDAGRSSKECVLPESSPSADLPVQGAEDITSHRLTEQQSQEIGDTRFMYACEMLLSRQVTQVLTLRQLQRLDREIHQQLHVVIKMQQPTADRDVVHTTKQLLIDTGEMRQHLNMKKINTLTKHFLSDRIKHAAESPTTGDIRSQQFAAHYGINRSQSESSGGPSEGVTKPFNADTSAAEVNENRLHASKRQANHSKSVLPEQRYLYKDLVTPEVLDFLPPYLRNNLDELIKNDVTTRIRLSNPHVDPREEFKKLVASGNVCVDLRKFYQKLDYYIKKTSTNRLKKKSADQSMAQEIDVMVSRMRDLEIQMIKTADLRKQSQNIPGSLSTPKSSPVKKCPSKVSPLTTPDSSNILSQTNIQSHSHTSMAENATSSSSLQCQSAEGPSGPIAEDGMKRKKKRSRGKRKGGSQLNEDCVDKSVTEERKEVSEPPKAAKKHVKDHSKVKKISGKETFQNYIAFEAVASGLQSGELVRGFVRINPKNFKVAYVNHEDSRERDYVINSLVDRNRALEGDEVVLKVKPEPEWIDGCKTAEVVYILQKVHPRTCIGKLVLTNINFDAEFYPRDQRFPILKIPRLFWPGGFANHPKLYEEVIFCAQLTQWNPNQFPSGILLQLLGATGDLATETKAILTEHSLDVTPYPVSFNSYFPQSDEIPQREFDYRLDLRRDCLFTIDPATARDLDDAVSCRRLPNGNYEVGVHISDAAHFLTEDTPLDQKVRQRATTVYLVDQAYHMLPIELCMRCSLLPGKDKLAFSVVWEMTPEAEVVSTRFARSVVNSCVQLAYGHAQAMIEHPDKRFGVKELPPIYNGFGPGDVSESVNALQRLAVKMRQRRFDNGALRIDQIKLCFSLEPVTGKPLGFCKEDREDANRLIEEFMLLANISVAEKIYDSFPDIAFLRCHEPPKMHMLIQLQRCLETFGIVIDIRSSKSLRVSLQKYQTDDYFGQYRSAVLNHVLTKAMTRAKYFCAADRSELEQHRHYALSVPMYTHFTSPIRRYSDIMVHRLLAASLGYTPKPKWRSEIVSAIAANCNTKKYQAKKAGEASSDLYLVTYIGQHQPCIADAVVVDVKDRAYDVLVLDTGSIVRLYFNKLEPDVKVTSEFSDIRNIDLSMPDDEEEESAGKIWKHIVHFPKVKDLNPVNVVIEMFSIIKISLSKVPKKLKLEGKLLRPVQSPAAPELLGCSN